MTLNNNKLNSLKHILKQKNYKSTKRYTNKIISMFNTAYNICRGDDDNFLSYLIFNLILVFLNSK